MKRIVSILLLLCLVGCGYRMRPLQSLHKNEARYQNTVSDVTVRITKLNREAARNCFDGKVIPKALVPFLITIKNSSSLSITMKNRNVSLPLLNYDEVYDRLSRSVMAPRAIAGAVAIGSAIAGSVDAFRGNASDALGHLLVADTALLSGELASRAAAHGNNKFAIDLAHKILHEVTLWPGEKVTKLMFVNRDQFKRYFKVNIYKMYQKSKKKFVDHIVFNVSL